MEKKTFVALLNDGSTKSVVLDNDTSKILKYRNANKDISAIISDDQFEHHFKIWNGSEWIYYWEDTALFLEISNGLKKNGL